MNKFSGNTGPGPSKSTSPDKQFTNEFGSGVSAAWAPVSNPDSVSTVGALSSYRAWSTSKPLVVAAVLAQSPEGLTQKQKSWAKRALTHSDNQAINKLQESVFDTDKDAAKRMQKLLTGARDQTTRVSSSRETINGQPSATAAGQTFWAPEQKDFA